MNPKDTADIYLKIADYASARHDRRRDFEWKLSFALWLVLLAPYWSSKKIDIGVSFNPALTGAFIALLYAFLWLRPIWLANESDKSLAVHSWKIAEKLARTGQAELSEPPQKSVGSILSLNFLADAAMRLHLLVTLFLATLFARALQ